jgi:AraC-like DNA-binding protein
MQVSYRRLRPAEGVEVLRDPHHGHGVHCVRALGRNTHASASHDVLTLWVCLRGKMEVETADGPFRLRARQFVCLTGAAVSRGVARDAADWLLLVLPRAHATRLLRVRSTRHLPEPLFFPTRLPITRALMRSIAVLLRRLDAQDGSAVDILLESVLQATLEAQAPVRPWIARACGRSDGHRRQAVMRLLSARNRVLNQPFDDHDLEGLAAAARYSKSHFLRIFRKVFGNTPHDTLIQARMELARRMISNSDLAISEVAANVGYESRHAFSRLFKKRFGKTASGYRLESPSEVTDAA